MAGTEAYQGEDGTYPLDARPPMEHARTSAFEVYRKPHQGINSLKCVNKEIIFL